jgi:hypothetical protein
MLTTSACNSGSNTELAEVACCHEDCSDDCKEVCEANGHACSIDENDKSCCVAEDGSKLEECCDGEMAEGEKACCAKG